MEKARRGGHFASSETSDLSRALTLEVVSEKMLELRDWRQPAPPPAVGFLKTTSILLMRGKV